MKNPTIGIVKKSDAKTLKEINHLLSQLSLTASPPRALTHGQFNALVDQKNVFFLTATTETGSVKNMIGFVIIYFIRIASGFFAVAEDLVVDEPYRRWGIGRLLMEYGIEMAEKKHARHISLRTNPKRTDANKLYRQMGFKQMPTNFFRINLPRKKQIPNDKC